MSESPPFWETKALNEMTDAEWESLCDGCARCCLLKLEDDYSKKVFYTSVACNLLNLNSCRCNDYPNRHKLVPECITINAQTVSELSWLPPTCAYRLLSEGEDLPPWHPLKTGSSDSVHEAGISVRCFAQPEDQIDDVIDHIIDL